MRTAVLGELAASASYAATIKSDVLKVLLAKARAGLLTTTG
jgi:hypothetical protein